MTRPYVYLDLGFYGPCNLKCEYCRSKIVRDDGRATPDRIRRILNVFCASNRAAVAKTSGYGEITMWRHFETTLDMMAERFPVVQVITNGTFGSQTLDAMLSRPTVSPNLTIDGHTLAMNTLRVAGQPGMHARILDNLRLLADGGKRVEINCVLHDHNARDLTAFCDYLAELYEDQIMLFPFPARSFSLAPDIGSRLSARISDSAAAIRRLAETHRAILPPSPYMEELATFIANGGRRSPCYVHWLNAGCGPKHERLYCANYGEDLSYGPMDDETSKFATSIALMENVHFAAGRVGPRCDDCFNHFHVLGMYLDGRVSLEEMSKVPSLSFAGVREILIEVRAHFSTATNSLGALADH